MALTLIMGFGVPVAVRKDWSLGFGYNMQFQYALPPNIGGLFNLYNPVTYAIEYRKRRSVKEQRDTSREYFYLFIETLLEMRGMHGKSCLLRMICEEAEAPVGHDGIMGEILHIILTPQENPGPVNKNLIEYSEARHAGHARADCRNLYPDCPPDRNMLDAISSAFHY
ncbi:uncharacterized protein LOC113382950 [Ctenocephalides felis]|uniref:uncharacterized protein LOC113382950 n=1 Tax=Ctenocephalides felis TaxID=7515 RepID=UPI000E6E1FC0|nr:uncharacterized protein LOC113382950 [Ctenocephalides felis]